MDRKKQEENQKEKLNEDLAFLDDQYGARVFSMGSMDVEYADKVSNKENRQLKEEEAHQNWLADAEERRKAEVELK